MNISTRTLLYTNIALLAFLSGLIAMMALDVKSINIDDLNTSTNWIANSTVECEE